MYTDQNGTDINRIFVTDIQYEVPRYQRRYVWDETNWQKLWEDIRGQGELGFDDRGHFTGPTVMLPIGKGQLKRFEVIDGQQRLTTFQIIFCVIRDICKLKGYNDLVEESEKHLINSDTTIKSVKRQNPEASVLDPTYKFLPTDYDKSAFQAVVEGDYRDKNLQVFTEGEKFSQNIIDAYDFFYRQITSHIGEDCDEDSVSDLITSIKSDFTVVQIVLDPSDQPEKIFESLNATGRMLSEFDYLRNNLFLRAGKLGIHEEKCKPYSDDFYEENWPFENDSHYWDADTLEAFLQAFLIAKLGPVYFEKKNIKLFEAYREYSKTLTIDTKMEYESEEEYKSKQLEYEFKQLSDYAESYNEMNDSDKGIYLLQFHEELDLIFDNLNLTSLHPFMLFIKHETGLSDIDLTRTFNMLESYIVRGLLSHGVNGNKYICRRINLFFSNLIRAKQGEFNVEDREINDFFSSLINAMQGKFNVEEFANFLFYSGKPGDGARWLHDGAVINGLRRVGDQIRAGGLTQMLAENMLGYILYRIERWKIEKWNQENPSKPAKEIGFDLKNFLMHIKDDGSRGTIETDIPLRIRLLLPRSRLHKLKDLYSIGNLVFCTEHFDAHLSFRYKKETLSDGINADIMLNQEICRDYETNVWSVNQIIERERNLLICFGKIWPPPKRFIAESSDTRIETKTIQEQISKPKTKPKVELQWVSMLQSDNYQPVTFVTYSKSVELSKVEQIGDAITGVDRDNKEQELRKSNILFACSSTSWAEVESYAETLPSVVRERIGGPPKTKAEQLHIQDKLLRAAQNEQIQVFPVTRCGHQLGGTIEDFDKDAIYMQIRECPVIVFRHGLYEFALDEWHQGVVTEFDENLRYGYIKSNSDHFEQNIFVHIEEIMDRSIRTLQPNQKVEFELNHTTKGTRFSAINVKLIEE